MNDGAGNERFTRRQFLIRAAKAGALVSAACAIGYGFHDARAPLPAPDAPSTNRLQDFSIPGLGGKMSIARGGNRTVTLRSAVAALGGIETFIKKGDRVLLKVNAAFASPPLLSATTHPQLVSEMTALCLQAGAVSVAVTDNPINDPASCFALSGIADAARAAGAEVLLPETHLFKPLTVDGGKLIRNWPVLVGPFQKVDKLIGLAPVKDHHRSGASMTMKNWYGLLGGRRNVFHQDIHTIIKELAMMVRPTLVILDGTTTMMTNGPTGGSVSDLKPTHTLIVGTDQVATDAFGVGLLGKPIDALAHIAKAESAGVGTADYRSLNPIFVGA